MELSFAGKLSVHLHPWMEEPYGQRPVWMHLENPINPNDVQ